MIESLELMKKWFDRIAQMAEYKTTLSGKRMTDSDAFDEIKVFAKDASEYLRMLSEKIEEKENIKPVKVSIDDVYRFLLLNGICSGVKISISESSYQ